ncbi:MAG: hypothetical protein AB7G47_14845 [Mycolicibacterium sp.]|uniref:hypothetical protein n=1 Tax=Mycolicibacterium sp. TaxID=2320850 RepID=UPI003D0F534C
MLIYRLLQQILNTDPRPLHELIGGIDRPQTFDLPNEASGTEAPAIGRLVMMVGRAQPRAAFGAAPYAFDGDCYL